MKLGPLPEEISSTWSFYFQAIFNLAFFWSMSLFEWRENWPNWTGIQWKAIQPSKPSKPSKSNPTILIGRSNHPKIPAGFRPTWLLHPKGLTRRRTMEEQAVEIFGEYPMNRQSDKIHKDFSETAWKNPLKNSFQNSYLVISNHFLMERFQIIQLKQPYTNRWPLGSRQMLFLKLYASVSKCLKIRSLFEITWKLLGVHPQNLGWLAGKIPIFNRKYIFNHGGFFIGMLAFTKVNVFLRMISEFKIHPVSVDKIQWAPN